MRPSSLKLLTVFTAGVQLVHNDVNLYTMMSAFILNPPAWRNYIYNFKHQYTFLKIFSIYGD